VFPQRSQPPADSAARRAVRRRAWLARCLPALLSAVLAGCAGPGYRDAGEALAAFTALAGQPQVRYAGDAEAQARQVAALLPDAVRRVEAFHQRPFREPPVVYVCDTAACFHRFVAAQWNYTAAVVYDNRLLLAPRLFERESARLRPVLLHELSHLHLGQYRGHYSMAIPVWFHEGLASLVADGGGADLVNDEEAWRSALDGKHFLADEQHLPWRRTRAEAWGISISLFYRQAMLFLAHLRARDTQAFARLLAALEDGADFDAAFAEAFQANPAHLAQAFFGCADAQLTADPPGCPPRGGHAAGAP
jgi:hypothetical protein